MRIFERWYFGLCWNLRLVIELYKILKDFGFSKRIFWTLYFCMVKYLSFHMSSFALKIHIFNVNGKVIHSVTHPLFIYSLIWTPCLMPRCVCIWQYILQNYNYKLHFQNLSIYRIPHVFIGTLAVENLDVCTACDPWDSNIQLTMVKDQRRQIYPKCHSKERIEDDIDISKSWGCPPPPPPGRACLS
jgi:hypothetical protein